jgi:hypothetical protein
VEGRKACAVAGGEERVEAPLGSGSVGRPVDVTKALLRSQRFGDDRVALEQLCEAPALALVEALAGLEQSVAGGGELRAPSGVLPAAASTSVGAPWLALVVRRTASRARMAPRTSHRPPRGRYAVPTIASPMSRNANDTTIKNTPIRTTIKSVGMVSNTRDEDRLINAHACPTTLLSSARSRKADPANTQDLYRRSLAATCGRQDERDCPRSCVGMTELESHAHEGHAQQERCDEEAGSRRR